MKNYYHNDKRKFTFFNLEIRNLDKIDIIILSLFLISIIVNILILTSFKESSLISVFTITFIIVNFMLIESSFLLRFRSIFFSIIWFFLSLIFLITSNNLGKIPFLTFLLFHILRIIFYYKYKREFIPYTAGRGKLYRYVCKIEGRGGYKEDRKFTKIFLFLGIIIILLCFLVETIK